MAPKTIVRLLTLTLALVTGCSALPGLGVITGDESGQDEAQRTLEVVDLVMADKTGATDPSLIAAANRIEAAVLGVDIIEIRHNLSEDSLVVNMLFAPPGDVSGQSTAGLVNLYTAIQRANEFTWQGTAAESEGSSMLQVNFITPQGISTLDSGPGFIGVVTNRFEIERIQALSYLKGPRGLNDFLDLIAEGTLFYENTDGFLLYEGEPNHPLFMLGGVGEAGQ